MECRTVKVLSCQLAPFAGGDDRREMLPDLILAPSHALGLDSKASDHVGVEILGSACEHRASVVCRNERVGYVG
mgnify:CR=1 FL=1